MSLRIGIVEDELKAILLLHSRIVDVIQEYELVFVAQSVEEALKKLDSEEIDLLFLDVHLKDRNGFEIFAELDDISFEVVFTTAHSQYSTRAFRINALDYILKPYSEKDVKNAIDKYFIKKNQINDELLSRMEQLFNEVEKIDRLVIKERGRMIFIKVEQIISVKADRAYCHISLADGQKITCSRNLSYIEGKLENCHFIRVHKSHLINAQYITQFNTSDHQVQLSNGNLIPVSSKLNRSILDTISSLRA